MQLPMPTPYVIADKSLIEAVPHGGQAVAAPQLPAMMQAPVLTPMAIACISLIYAREHGAMEPHCGPLIPDQGLGFIDSNEAADKGNTASGSAGHSKVQYLVWVLPI